MGSVCTQKYNQSVLPEYLDPMESTFVTAFNMVLPQKYNKFLEKLKLFLPYHDVRKAKNLKWYKSVRYDFYVYGQVRNGKPFGECLIYSTLEQVPQMPIVIATKIDAYGSYSPKTLIIFSDLSYYFGQINSKSQQFPKASGNGLIVSKDYIYEGEFLDGYPEGHGYFKTKYRDYVGWFKDSKPHGEGVERSRAGLFIGQIVDNRKRGILITPENQKYLLNES